VLENDESGYQYVDGEYQILVKKADSRLADACTRFRHSLRLALSIYPETCRGGSHAAGSGHGSPVCCFLG